jgi:hypothetical protein
MQSNDIFRQKGARMSGPYIISDPSLLVSLVNKPAVVPPSDAMFGVQCVGLVKVYAKCPATSSWKAGILVKDLPHIQEGTAIATFIHGHYPSHASGNHACFFVEFLSNGTGFVVLEQHVPPHRNLIQKRTIYYNQPGSPSNNGSAYSVIL